MEETKQKPKFEPQKQLNVAHLVTFEASKPFYSQENQYGKMSYGYNVVVDGNDHVWFASEAVNNLIKLKNVQQGEEISIEFKSGTNQSTNQPYKIWLLNGKSSQDLAQEQGIGGAPGTIATPSPVSTTPEPVEATPSSGPTDAEKLAIMWDAHIKANPQIKAQTEAVTDADLPF